MLAILRSPIGDSEDFFDRIDYDMENDRSHHVENGKKYVC